MIDVATLSVIRRWALREHLSIREIARRTGLSRNTIRKYLRSDVVQPQLAQRTISTKLDPFASKLSGWLRTEANRSRKQRRTIKQMFLDLQALGYTGSYNRVAAFARVWKAQCHAAEQTSGRGVFVPLVFGTGEAFQFDWSEDWAVIAGVRTKLQVAHFKLSHNCVRCSCENSVIRKSILLANSVLLFLPRPAAAGAVAMDLLRLESICGQQITQHAVVDGINAKQRVEGLQALRLNRFHQAHFPCFADHHLLKRGGMDQLFAQCI